MKISITEPQVSERRLVLPRKLLRRSELFHGERERNVRQRITDPTPENKPLAKFHLSDMLPENASSKDKASSIFPEGQDRCCRRHLNKRVFPDSITRVDTRRGSPCGDGALIGSAHLNSTTSFMSEYSENCYPACELPLDGKTPLSIN